jgi:hypothetical protein
VREHAHWLGSPSNAIDPVKTLVKEQGGHISELSCGYGVAEALQICLRKAAA